MYCHIELDRFKQLKKAIMREENISVTGFCRQYERASLTQNLHFLMTKLGSIWVGTLMVKTKCNGAVLIWDRLQACPFMIRWLEWCAMTATWIARPIFLKQTNNSEWYVTDIFGPFLRVLWKKKRHMTILCKMVGSTTNTANYSINVSFELDEDR
jgi:hypothetical protein